jgi:hypothetical protein
MIKVYPQISLKESPNCDPYLQKLTKINQKTKENECMREYVQGDVNLNDQIIFTFV